MGRLEGKVALVSGGAQGMGEAEVRVFAAEGAKVVIGDIQEEAGSALAKEIGDAATFVALDVTRAADWSAAVDACVERYGSLTTLVNNAGIASTGPLLEISLADYQAVIDVNQTGVFLGMQAAGRTMLASGGGSIVNISSIDGIVGMVNLTAYVASKFAVRGMTKVAAIELASQGIRVNSIHPGYVDTPMANPANEEHPTSLEKYAERAIPLAKMARPEDIANMALFLASDDSAYCTGAEFVVDGGLLAGITDSGEPSQR